MIKIKKHRIIRGFSFPIFKSSEKLAIDKSDFSKLKTLKDRFQRHNYELVNLNDFVKRKSLKNYIGIMVKDRVKDFIFDTDNGRIYAIAVTFCKSKGHIQKQLEVEYAGYLPGYKNSKRNIEKQIIDGVQEISGYIYEQLSNILSPSVERKFEFVKKYNS